jgi:hypothetical protein
LVHRIVALIGIPQDLVLRHNCPRLIYGVRRVDDMIRKVKADVVLDATAEKDYGRIVRRWKTASENGRPFCLAINQCSPFCT